MSKQLFLATTALEDFWDTSKPIIFLSEGCKRYSRREIWQKLDYRMGENPWKNPGKNVKICEYVAGVINNLLPHLSKALNVIHNTQHSERTWRILVGPWLNMYVTIFYDRYVSIERTLELYPDITSIGLSDESFVVPRDTDEYNWLINEDSYNLQVYTRIFQFLGINYSKKKTTVSTNLDFYSVNWVGRIKTAIFGLLKVVGKVLHHDRSIVIKGAHFSSATTLKLFIKTLGVVWPDPQGLFRLSPLACNQEMRKKLQDGLPSASSFEKLLKSTIPFDMPQSLLEGFSKIVSTAARKYSVKPKAVLSANAWYYDEVFKYWAARSAENGTILLGAQHGGNYGSLYLLPSENHEVSIVDRFYSWGWERNDCPARVVPFVASKLAGREMLPASKVKGHILFVSTIVPRYYISLIDVSNQFVDYLSWQRRFIHTLSKEVRSNLHLRPHCVDYGWDMTMRWHDDCPDVQVESWKTSFLDSLSDCSLYLCDHLSTTFMEALAAGKPTILFWNPEQYSLRANAASYYEKLRLVGILYDTPESASSAINKIYPEVELWWNNSARQEAVREFCHQFARTSPTAIRDWAQEFRAMM